MYDKCAGYGSFWADQKHMGGYTILGDWSGEVSVLKLLCLMVIRRWCCNDKTNLVLRQEDNLTIPTVFFFFSHNKPYCFKLQAILVNGM